MPGSDGLGILVILVSWDLNLGEASPAEGYGMRGAFVRSVSWDFDSEPGSLEVSWDLNLGEASPAGGYGMRCTFVGSDGTVSIVKIVSLLVSKN